VCISTIDLVGNGYLLLTGAKGKAWLQAGKRLAADMGLNLKALTIGTDGMQDPDKQWPAAYGLDDAGAVLVRPDGYVGWRSPSMVEYPTATLRGALIAMLGNTY
jgi:putative polyketide hydroxylase